MNDESCVDLIFICKPEKNNEKTVPVFTFKHIKGFEKVGCNLVENN